MVINEEFLQSAGAEIKTYNIGEKVFSEGGNAIYYYQILEGSVKLLNSNKDGKEYIHYIINDGQCFGYSFLFSDKKYAIDAVAMEKSSIYRLQKDNFLTLLEEYPQFYYRIQKALSAQMYYQYIMSQANTLQPPAERLLNLMTLLKGSQLNATPFTYIIPFTRQQLANLTGLCVETTIRTIKDMERKKLVRIRDRKIFF